MEQQKVWLQEYPDNIPAEINPNEFASLKEIIEQSFSQFRQRPAYSNMGVTLSYADLDQRSQAFGAYLQNVLNLQKGARVAIMMPNLLQYPIALFAILRSGMTAVNVNPLYTARELKHQLNDSGAETIVILENFAHTLAEVISETPVKNVIVTRIGDCFPGVKGLLTNLVVKHVKKMVPPWHIGGVHWFKSVLTEGRRHSLQNVEINQNDIAFLQYTGGTTGVSKGAVLSHGNMVANILQVDAWMSAHTKTGEEIVITALPLYHIFSLTANCLVFLRLGGHNILITNPRDMKGFVKELGNYRFSIITGVNTLFNGLLNTPGFADLDFSPLKFALGGGMAVQGAVAERWQKVTGIALLEGYGLTETSPVACVNPLDSKTFSASIGIPISSTDVSIRDEQGQPLAQGEVGEICIKGPQVMQGYWQRPEETAKVLKDGWFYTGDMGMMDEKGYFRIVDRKKDMILVSGFNVYPNEIEDVLATNEKIVESAAIGVPDEKSGEIVKVFVVKKDPGLTEDEVIQHCKQNLTGYKVPKKVEFRDDLPKSNVGKILRRELRESASG